MRDDKFAQLDQRVSYRPPQVTGMAVSHSGSSFGSVDEEGGGDEFLPVSSGFRVSTRGTKVQFVGRNFGLCPQVIVGPTSLLSCGVHASKDLLANHTHLSFTMPEGEGTVDPQGKPLSIRVVVGGQDLVCPSYSPKSVDPSCLGYEVAFTYMPPRVLSATPSRVNTR